MIVGNGMIARAFSRYADYDSIVLFASGVANSGTTDEREFAREQELLSRTLSESGNRLFVYISTCSVYDEDAARTPYVRHKLDMETLVSRSAATYLVLRLPQVVGSSTNPHTLVNYLRDRIIRGEHFVVWKNAVRYLIDVTDVVRIAVHLIGHTPIRNRAINIASRPSFVPDMVAILESIMGKRATCTILDKGRPYQIENTLSLKIAAELNIHFDDRYVESTLRKYYGQRT